MKDSHSHHELHLERKLREEMEVHCLPRYALVRMLARSDMDWKQGLPIALLGFQSAGQIVSSRVLSLSEIPSVVITSVLCDLVSDPQLAAGWRGNVKRNRRTLAFLGILMGAATGGLVTRRTGKIPGALWVAGWLKAIVTLAWVVWTERGKGQSGGPVQNCGAHLKTSPTEIVKTTSAPNISH